jgi:PAS domain S-box-containing protein
MTLHKNDKTEAERAPGDASALETRERAAKLDRALRESEEKYRSLFNQSVSGIYIHDVEGRILDVNQTAVRQSGYSKEELLELTVFDLHPDQSDKDEILRIWHLSEPGQRHTIERKHRRKDGTIFTVLISTGVVRYGNRDHILTIVQDITDQREVEENLLIKEYILSSSSSVIAISDLTGMMTYANPVFEKLWGFDDPEEYLGKPFRDFWLVDDIYENIMEALLVEGAWIGDLKARRKDGTLFDVQVSAATVYDANGNPIALTSTSIDIAKRKRAEAEILRLNQTLEQQVAERTEIAEARARQLQTLAVEMVEAEERERQRIAQILHDDLQQILVSARFQTQSVSQKANLNPVLVNIDRLLEDAIATSRRLSQQLSPPVLHQFGLAAALEWLVLEKDKQFGLKIHLEKEVQDVEDSSLKVFIFRAVQELLFNIVKHSGVKSANVLLSAFDHNVVLTISDQGCGFNPEILNSSVKKSGLGLASLRERARAIGGNLVIDSAPGHGCRFTLTVPRSLSEINVPQSYKRKNEPRPQVFVNQTAAMNSEDIRVLFADDHQVLRQGLIGLVTGQPDIQVVGEASNGEEALELTRQLNPSLVVMDISMPKMDGIEATRRIKAEMPEVQVIGLSMFDGENIARKMREAGAAAFVSKSESSTELLKAIYKVTGKGSCAGGSSN